MATEPITQDRECTHDRTSAFVVVNKLTAVEGGPVTSYSADVRIDCADCAESFVFIGPGMGFSPHHPMTSVDGLELRAPIRPASKPEGWGQAGPGFGVNVR